jgi:hypothetical protein
MQLRVVKRIESAVQSVSTCADPTVQVGSVVARAGGLCSPYISRRTVEYAAAEKPLPIGEVVYAASSRYTLLIGAPRPQEVVPPTPAGGAIVTYWEGGVVPTSLVQPVIELAWKLRLAPHYPYGKTTHTWVLSPVLAGWHYGRPVFWASTGENTPVELDGEPTYRQGSLLVGWSTGDVPFSDTWANREGCPTAWFFNHATAYEGRERAMATPAEEAMVSPVAVLYNGAPHAAVRLYGPALLVARDHEDLNVPEGNFLAIHPIPQRDVD